MWADHFARLGDLGLYDLQALDALLIVHRLGDLEGLEAQLHRPIQIVAGSIA